VEVGQADVNQHTLTGPTPLVDATLKSQYKVMEYLLQRKADVSLKTERGGLSPLTSVAITRSDTSAVQILLRHVIARHTQEMAVVLDETGTAAERVEWVKKGI